MLILLFEMSYKFFLACSVKLLQKDKNNSPESKTKLPQMAKQLEVSLYRDAPSKEAYMDISTLKQRLQQIAVEVARKSQSRSANGVSNNRSNYPHQSQQPPQQQSQQHQMQQQQQQQAYNSQSNKMMRQDMTGTTSPYMSTSNNPNPGQMVNMEDINPTELILL